MKYFISLLISFVFTIHLFANDDEKIKQLVYKWNNAHSNQKISDFIDLYAPQVIFYGKSYTDNECYIAKLRLLKSRFAQQIISSVDIAYYASGTIKAVFTKRTQSGKKVKEHFCYLLFKSINGRYLITGESDNLTDERKDTKLNLGEPIKQNTDSISETNDTALGIIFFLVFAVVSVGVYVFIKRKKAAANQELWQLYSPPQSKQAVIPINTKPDNASKQKGDAFENYVVERFNKPCFKLKEWRSDKIHNGVYAESNRLPDLEYHFKTNYAECYFAVECKWRASFFEGRIEWAKEYQLENYRKFSQERQIPVFVVIGIGEKPNDPKSLYIVPLNNINSIHLYQNEIQPYFRYSKSTFYFDAENLKLS